MRAAPWRVKGGLERKYGEEGVDSTVKEGRFQGGEGGQARRVSVGEVQEWMSGCKSSLGRSAEWHDYLLSEGIPIW